MERAISGSDQAPQQHNNRELTMELLLIFVWLIGGITIITVNNEIAQPGQTVFDSPGMIIAMLIFWPFLMAIAMLVKVIRKRN